VTAALSLPSRDALARLLRDLFGRAVAAKGVSAPAATKCFIASYVDAEGRVAALAVCDVAAGATLGSAIALIPSGAAADAARAGRLTADMVDNLREVLNVAASLFTGLHVTFREVLPPGAPLAPDQSAILSRPSARLDSSVEVTGYTAGVLSLLVR
jgi:hypothetical protein